MDRPAGRPLDVFIDLTAAETPPARDRDPWPSLGRFPTRPRRVTCAARPGTWPHLSTTGPRLGWRIVWCDSAVGACSQAMTDAGSDRASLLLLQGPVDAGDEAVLVLHECLRRDPMFASAAPRIRCAAGCCLRALPRAGLDAAGWIPRRTWGETRDVEIVPELFDSSLLMLPEVTAEFGGLDGRFSSLASALVHHLSRARRCGYRTVLANRAVMEIRGQECDGVSRPCQAETDSDRALLRRLVPELERSWEESRAGSQGRFEAVHAHAVQTAKRRLGPSLLLDIRNVTTVHNGTTQAVLGCVRALQALSVPWDVAVLANPAAATFHALRDLCGRWPLHTTLPARPFTAALRLSQPWHIQEMIDLHRAALITAYFMLDTIAWDVVYAAPPRHDGTWSFLADHADGYLFDSAFTEQRFLSRFERARATPRAVCHYPFDPAEYVRADAKRTAPSDYILVAGNELDHKDVLQTVRLISEAFPFQPIVAFGVQGVSSPFLRAVHTGSLSDGEVHGLYAGARLVVFPSFYEGFGFPIVTALAYGRTLITRQSALVKEIAERCAASTGRLVTFTRREELVEIIGRLLHGQSVPEEPIGSGVSGKLRSWPLVGRDIVGFVETLVREPHGLRWLAREQAITQLLAFGREARTAP